MRGALCLQVREGNERALELYVRRTQPTDRYEVLDSRVPVDVPTWQEHWKGGPPGTPLTLMRKRVDLPLDQLLERAAAQAAEWSGKRGVRAIDPEHRPAQPHGAWTALGPERERGRPRRAVGPAGWARLRPRARRGRAAGWFAPKKPSKMTPKSLQHRFKDRLQNRARKISTQTPEMNRTWS